MPIYEYKCGACSHEFEYLVMGGKDPESCPKCGDKNVAKLMSRCGFVSKGAGGEISSSSASGSSCTGCTATSCAGCGS
ncbi:FmdB family zinc ribbon protein [Desulfoluna butyratoxydans]|uniref:Putative regulatory protein fmdb zinc ribbon domain n=1 Tax=Desulfoluna butyratoxydans TaxID=231438 RepID=A0A4U8YIK2_9BACT|nr:zinc ribbon domain-containing protein [Desulfoluna butyratoxydans]VFQ43084.1 putative regulatory protein fmdb zinc ribbon domain [Desulfoluna butyratoxydans]